MNNIWRGYTLEDLHPQQNSLLTFHDPWYKRTVKKYDSVNGFGHWGHTDEGYSDFGHCNDRACPQMMTPPCMGLRLLEHASLLAQKSSTTRKN